MVGRGTVKEAVELFSGDTGTSDSAFSADLIKNDVETVLYLWLNSPVGNPLVKVDIAFFLS